VRKVQTLWSPHRYISKFLQSHIRFRGKEKFKQRNVGVYPCKVQENLFKYWGGFAPKPHLQVEKATASMSSSALSKIPFIVVYTYCWRKIIHPPHPHAPTEEWRPTTAVDVNSHTFWRVHGTIVRGFQPNDIFLGWLTKTPVYPNTFFFAGNRHHSCVQWRPNAWRADIVVKLPRQTRESSPNQLLDGRVHIDGYSSIHSGSVL